jgi:hypothetical protein
MKVAQRISCRLLLFRGSLDLNSFFVSIPPSITKGKSGNRLPPFRVHLRKSVAAERIFTPLRAIPI